MAADRPSPSAVALLRQTDSNRFYLLTRAERAVPLTGYTRSRSLQAEGSQPLAAAPGCNLHREQKSPDAYASAGGLRHGELVSPPATVANA